MAKIEYTKLFLEEENSPENYFNGFVISRTKLEFSKSEVNSGGLFQLHFFLYSAKEGYGKSNAYLKGVQNEFDLETIDRTGFLAYHSTALRAEKQY